MALHTRVEGQLQIQRYLTRGLTLLPYGPGASLVHVDGSDRGGGYEWHAARSFGVDYGEAGLLVAAFYFARLVFDLAALVYGNV